MSCAKQEKLLELISKVDKNVPARKRLTALFDENTFVELDEFMQKDEKEAGVIAGYGMIEGGVVYAYSQDVTIDSGAISKVNAKKVKKVYELASKTGCPIVSIFDSNGAKLDEANMMLSAYSKMLMWANNLSGVVPQISLVLGTCAGTSAMICASADFVIMSKKAELYMTAPFVSKANGDKTQNAGSAQNAAKAGIASIVCEDENAAIEQARKVITMLPINNLAPTPFFEFVESTTAIEVGGCPKDIVKAIADEDSLIEINADYANGIFTFLATLAGVSTGFVATSMLNAIDVNSCDKATRFVKTCDAFNIPIITLVNSAGFELTADLSLVKRSAELASAYAEATTAKVSVITGKAYGPVYITLGSKNANSDLTIAWPQAEISALAPETAVEFLMADKLAGVADQKTARDALVEEYLNTVASPFEAAKGGFIDKVISPENTRQTLINMFDILASKRESKLPKKHSTI